MILSSMLRKSLVRGLQNKMYCASSSSLAKCFSTSVDKKDKKELNHIPKNILEPHITAHTQADFGKVYDKKPFKVRLEANKKYKWCTCGWSKSQPFCDGTHKNPYMKLTLKPVVFAVEEDKDYYLCNCKHTAHRPFCDGTHKRQDIQDQVKS